MGIEKELKPVPDKQWGKINFKIEEVRKAKGIGVNQLCELAHVQKTQLKGYRNGTVTKLDVNVLARLCKALECKTLTDIIEYIQQKTDN